MCSVSIEDEILVNGAPRSVLSGSALSLIAPGATHVELLRRSSGRLTRVNIDLSKPNALRSNSAGRSGQVGSLPLESFIRDASQIRRYDTVIHQYAVSPMDGPVMLAVDDEQALLNADVRVTAGRKSEIVGSEGLAGVEHWSGNNL